MILIKKKTGKKWIGLLGCLIALFTLSSCSGINHSKGVEEITHWIGNKQGCIDYLNSPYAQSEKYLVEALKD